MKRDWVEFSITLFIFIFSLILLVVINNLPDLEDRIYLCLIILQVMGVNITLVAGFLNKEKKENKDDNTIDDGKKGLYK